MLFFFCFPMKVAKATFIVAEENPSPPPLNDSPDTDLKGLMVVLENNQPNKLILQISILSGMH